MAQNSSRLLFFKEIMNIMQSVPFRILISLGLPKSGTACLEGGDHLCLIMPRGNAFRQMVFRLSYFKKSFLL